jgi:iron complex outermembrane recepter protein
VNRFEAYALTSVGSDSMFNVEGMVNMPLGQAAALRVSLQSQNRDDWVTNTRGAPTSEMEGYNDHAARVQLLLTPNKDLSVLFNVHARDLKGSARVFRANIIKPGTNDFVDGFDENSVSQDGFNSQDVQTVGGNVRVRWNLGAMALSSITGYESVESFSRGDIDGGFGAVFLGAGNFGPGPIAFDAESADGLPKHSQFTQEFRLESTTPGALQWIAGLYYFDEQLNIDSFNYSSLGGSPPGTPVNGQNGFATQEQDNKAYAIYGTVNLDVSDRIKLRGGLRYTQDDKDFVADRIQAPPFSPTFIGQRTASTSANNTSADFSASYALDKTSNVYARVATGFRAPAIQGRLLFGDTLSVARSETVTSYEAGYKADLWDRRARVAFNVFSYEIKDQQLTAVGGAANFNQLVNAAKTTGRGAEFDFKLLPTDSLLLTLSGSVNKTKIQDPGLRVDACGNGCTVLDPITAPIDPSIGKFAPTVSINGNSLPQAPETTLAFSARYSMPVAGGELYVLTDWTYRSKINFFLYESVEYTGKPLTEGGLRLGYVFGNGQYEATAFVRNITNQIRVVGGIDFNNLTGFINEPRTFGVSFKASF